ncbi:MULTISPECIES: general stress protein [unclassified Saccharopolyspora]|uniref:general stress protein n=1 Tax=unclassified Saccharopolyspora TaxID=2646250 RepID=UPI001CD6CD48|nr:MULTISPECIES: HTTM domain-containing protein [unclassified Saccharopolyspora]MCA1188764.1 HTTM domain-containing protein [Saccharopolyspora sp. 6T]MCA1194489.1 HTTM domain-containing protein [Saccharopolyspora sp. 6V]MCA1226683.1 HTTM domain-containing protein [Saccharopolyspora sp. 6M]MCA1278978.1 HTTM domain-containing protein [Saccharopolyspora sp. 7B]
MSDQQPGASDAGGAPFAEPPDRRSIASYTRYADAEQAVDYLSDQDFPVERVAIVGHDVQFVEQVIGKLSYGRSALHGAGGGALTGVLIGWIFGLFSWIQPLLASFTLAIYGLVFGAIVGAMIGLLMYAAQGGRRDFSAVQIMQPTRYEVLVDAEVAGEASRLLQQHQKPQASGAVD